MRIGDIEVFPLIDGELLAPYNTFYPCTAEHDWTSHAELLEATAGEPFHLCTMGGYLIHAGDRLVVLDTGIGPEAVYPFTGGGFRSALIAAGAKRDDVTDVIFSHLHFDHIGWATQQGKPFFPNATYRVDRRDWDFFSGHELSDLEKQYCVAETDHPSARLGPIVDRLDFFEGEQEVLPGIRALEASGHTPGETVIELVSDGERGLLLGDTVHAEQELIGDNSGGLWNFAPHIDRDKAYASAERFRRMIIDERLPFAGAHFPGLRWSRLHSKPTGLEWEYLGS